MLAKSISFLMVFTCVFNFLNAQKSVSIMDSLEGFDEEAARRSAISEQFLGKEFDVRISSLKRQYISNKYGLWPKSLIQNSD